MEETHKSSLLDAILISNEDNSSKNSKESPKVQSNNSLINPIDKLLSVVLPKSKNVWRKQPELFHDISFSWRYETDDTNQKDELIANNNSTKDHTHHKSHRVEGWHELFYDLIFVAASLQIGKILRESGELTIFNIFQTGLLFFVLRTTWDHLMLYQNRFDTSDILHYLFYLLQSMTTLIMTMHLHIPDNEVLTQGHVKWSATGNVFAFSIAATIARVANVLMYLQIFLNTQEFRPGIRNFVIVLIGTQALGALFFTIASFSSSYSYFDDYLYLWLAAMFVEKVFADVLVIVLQRLSNLKGRVPEHFQHMVHRQGQFILLIIGEAVIQVVDSTNEFEFYDYFRGILGFTIIYSMGICYYQQQVICLHNPINVKKSILGYFWQALHQILALSILYFAVGVSLVYEEVRNETRQMPQEFLMTIGASCSLFLIATLRLINRGFNFKNPSQNISYFIRYTLAIMISFIPYMSPNSTSTIAILCCFTTLHVIQVS